MTQQQSVIEKLETSIAEGRALVREIHAATKDLRAAAKDARDVREEFNKAIDDKWQELFVKHVEDGIAEIAKLQQKMYKAIGEGFDRSLAPLMDSLELVRDVVNNQRGDMELPPVPPLPRPRGLRTLKDVIGEANNDE